MEATMSEFLKSNPQLDEAIRSARTVAEMREAMLSTLAAQGTVVRDRTDAYDVRVIPQAEPPALVSSSSPAPTGMRKCSDTWSRTVIFDNSRFELFADSEADLDAKEAAIRAILQGRS
jgi:hypothetical protein